jgi:hypothetical protein
MRVTIFLLCTCVLAIGFADAQNVPPKPVAKPLVEHDLGGLWTLRIENLSHKVVTTMTISFAGEEANSCMAGNWRRVVVSGQTSADKDFFPIGDPLSYEVTGNHIVIGRNEICDGYLQLDGRLSSVAASGEYIDVGLGGSKRLGYFSVTKGT